MIRHFCTNYQHFNFEIDTNEKHDVPRLLFVVLSRKNDILSTSKAPMLLY
jgi:hypothetical protein